MSIKIREIMIDDVAAYKQLRIEMVQKYPTAFNVNLEALAQRSDEDWKYDASHFIHNEYQKRYVATDNTEPVGIIGCIVCCETLEIGNFYVKPAYQRQGVGRLLLRHTLDFAAQTLCETAGLWVSDNNPVKNWYERLGFHSLQPPETVQHEIFPEIIEEYLVLELKK